MGVDKGKVNKVVNELETSIFLHGRAVFPNSFYDQLNYEERAEVVRIYRNKRGIGKLWREEK